DDVPEAVADRDLRDLAHPADVALLRTGSHALSVAALSEGLVDPADGRLPGAARRLDLDRVADPPAEQGRAERRRGRHRARAADGADLDGHRLAGVRLHVDDRADPDLVRGGLLDDLGGVEARPQRADARLEQPLLVLRGVVLEVLRQVAELARLLDRRNGLGAPRAFKLRELLVQGGRLLGSQPLAPLYHLDDLPRRDV